MLQLLLLGPHLGLERASEKWCRASPSEVLDAAEASEAKASEVGLGRGKGGPAPFRASGMRLAASLKILIGIGTIRIGIGILLTGGTVLSQRQLVRVFVVSVLQFVGLADVGIMNISSWY